MGDRKKIPNFFGDEPDPVQIATGTKRYSGKEEYTRSDTDTRKHSAAVGQSDGSTEESIAHSEEQMHSDMDDQKYSGIEERISGDKEERGKSSVEEQRKDSGGGKKDAVTEKKKTGYYLPVDMIETFDRIFYNLKLKGVRFKKNDLAEAIFKYGLKDLERGDASQILTKMIGK